MCVNVCECSCENTKHIPRALWAVTTTTTTTLQVCKCVHSPTAQLHRSFSHETRRRRCRRPSSKNETQHTPADTSSTAGHVVCWQLRASRRRPAKYRNDCSRVVAAERTETTATKRRRRSRRRVAVNKAHTTHALKHTNTRVVKLSASAC